MAISFAQTIPGPLNGHAPVGPVKAADLASYFLAHPPQAGNVVIAGQTGAVSKVIDGKDQFPNQYDVVIAGERFRVVCGSGISEASGLPFDELSVRRYFTGADLQNKGAAR